MQDEMRFPRDDLYDRAQAVVDFRFDERTAAVFADMIHRSIPGYAALLQMTAAVAGEFLRDGDHVYDLGCSLGGVSLAIRQFVAADCAITAVDLSPAMTARLRAYIAGAGVEKITVLEDDITTMTLQPCRLAALNFVLQFVAPSARAPAVEKIYRALSSGGVLLLAEKIRPQNDELRRWHESFKRLQGYSALAVAQKRESLERVMQSDDAATITTRLQAAGFSKVIPYYQGFSFMAWAAVK